VLKRGTLAPVFKAHTRNGGEFDLAAFRGRTVLVKFYRFATCPVCNLHPHRFRHEYPAIQALGIETVVLYHSPQARLEKAQREDTPFALVADPDKRIFKRFGVEQRWRGMFSLAVWRDGSRGSGRHATGVSAPSAGTGAPKARFVGDDKPRQHTAMVWRLTGKAKDGAGATGATSDGLLLRAPDGRQIAFAVFVADSRSTIAERAALTTNIVRAIANTY
jgi:peroxiredoxin